MAKPGGEDSGGGVSSAGMIAGIVVAVLVTVGLLTVGSYCYLSKMGVRRRATAAGISNVAYDNSKDETDSRSSAPDVVSWGRPGTVTVNGSNVDQRGGVASSGTSPASTWNMFDNVQDLSHYDVEIEKRLSNVRVGRLSFE